VAPSLTQVPGEPPLAMPIAARKDVRMPEPVCGMKALIGPALPPRSAQLLAGCPFLAGTVQV